MRFTKEVHVRLLQRLESAELPIGHEPLYDLLRRSCGVALEIRTLHTSISYLVMFKIYTFLYTAQLVKFTMISTDHDKNVIFQFIIFLNVPLLQ